MQERVRTWLPAVIAVSLHGVIALALMTIRPLSPDAPVAPLLWLNIAPPPDHPRLDFQNAGPPTARPGPRLIVPDLPTSAPADTAPTAPAGLSVLNDYMACGLARARSPEEEARCNTLRGELHALTPGDVDPSNAAPARAREFARAKAIQDAPVLLPCFTPAGPNPLCLLGGVLGGFTFETGSYAANGPPENPLAQPVFPYRPR